MRRERAIWRSSKQRRILLHPLIAGEEDFVAAYVRRVQGGPEYPRAALRLPRPPLEELATTAADTDAIARAHLEHGYSMREIASHLGCGIAPFIDASEATRRRCVERGRRGHEPILSTSIGLGCWAVWAVRGQ